MKGAAILAVYALLLYLGMRPMLAKGNRRDGLFYFALIGWCAYISLAKLYLWHFYNIMSPINAIFFPVGQWIDQFMGGVPGS